MRERAGRFIVSDERFTLPAYAKINLNLRVLGRRPDNYHEIQTVFQTITLHDRLTFESLDDERLELTCDAPDVPIDERNLVYRAAHALRLRYQISCGARVDMKKIIPAGGGLGGGSSNAAVALLGLASLWEMSISKPELIEIGSSLGADVPFFLTGGTALGTGLGTKVSPLVDAPGMSLVLVTPSVRVSTAEAYQALNAPALTKANHAAILSVSHADAQITDLLCDVTRNDFEPVIFELYPEINAAKEALLRVGGRKVLLAGSGSSVFGVFANRREAELACMELETEGAWRVFACETLKREEYRQALGRCAALL